MPIYLYLCNGCGPQEKITSVSGRDDVKCDKCGKKMERQPTSGALRFKGSGFYATDYGAKNHVRAD